MSSNGKHYNGFEIIRMDPPRRTQKHDKRGRPKGTCKYPWPVLKVGEAFRAFQCTGDRETDRKLRGSISTTARTWSILNGYEDREYKSQVIDGWMWYFRTK